MPGIEEHPYLLLAEWSPRGHGLIMVQDYDIYFRPSPTSPHWYRITDTAVPGVISNGVPDWLYEGITTLKLSKSKISFKITNIYLLIHVFRIRILFHT